jgi:hypothetical protein
MCIVVLVVPYIFTRNSFSSVTFTETGQIGDTIGGITSPFIGIISIFLLIKTLLEQQKFNQKQVEKDDYTLVKAISDDILSACNNLNFQYYSAKNATLETANGSGSLNLLDPTYRGGLTITGGEFGKLHQDALYIASLYSFWCDKVADTSFSSEMAQGFNGAISYYVEPVINYLKRYQINKSIPVYGYTISDEDKKQAKMMCDKVDGSLGRLNKLKPLK